MKIIYIECNEEEMRANRCFMDTLTDTFDGIAKALVGSGISPEAVKKAMESYEDDEQEETEEE